MSTQELLNSSNEVVFSNTPILLCDYDALLEHLKLPKEHQIRRLLEKKIACGDICFPDETLKLKCTESLRDLSPCKNKKGILCGFPCCVDSNWFVRSSKGKCISYMRCKYHDCPGIIKFSQLSVALNDPYSLNSGIKVKDDGTSRLVSVSLYVATVFYVSLYVPCDHHYTVLPNCLGGFSRQSSKGMIDGIEEELRRLKTEIAKYSPGSSGCHLKWMNHRLKNMENNMAFCNRMIVESIDNLCKEHCNESLVSLIGKRRKVEVSLEDITDIAEVFDVFDDALIKVFTTEDGVCQKAASEEIVDQLLKECEELTKKVDSFSITSQPPSQSWLEKKQKQLQDSFKAAKSLVNAACGIHEAIKKQYGFFHMAKKALTSTSTTSSGLSDNLFQPSLQPIINSPSQPSVQPTLQPSQPSLHSSLNSQPQPSLQPILNSPSQLQPSLQSSLNSPSQPSLHSSLNSQPQPSPHISLNSSSQPSLQPTFNSPSQPSLQSFLISPDETAPIPPIQPSLQHSFTSMLCFSYE